MMMSAMCFYFKSHNMKVKDNAKMFNATLAVKVSL